jgi:hypothetical protein
MRSTNSLPVSDVCRKKAGVGGIFRVTYRLESTLACHASNVVNLYQFSLSTSEIVVPTVKVWRCRVA